MGRSAQLEAANMLEQARVLLAELPEGPERLTLELDLTVKWAAALRWTKGYAAPEVEARYLKARELCIQTGAAGKQFNIEWGLYQCSFVKTGAEGVAELHKIGNGLFAHAERDTGRLVVDAHLAQGMTRFMLGEFAAAKTSFEAGTALARPETDFPHFMTHGQNAGSFCQSYLAYTLWFLGFPNQAKAKIDETLSLMRARLREPSHLYSYVGCVMFAVRVYQALRDTTTVKQLAQELIQVSRRNQYAYYEALALIQLGWALATEKSAVLGMEQMREGLRALEQTGSKGALYRPYTRLAEMCAVRRQRGSLLVAEQGPGGFPGQLAHLAGRDRAHSRHRSCGSPRC